VAIIGSYSRGALLAISAMLFFLAMKSRQRLLITIGLFGALALTIVFMPDKWMERMMTIGSYEQDSSAMGRIDAWLYAIDVATQNPIFGGGLGYQAGHIRVAHSIYFDTLGQHGFIGLTLFLLLGLSCLHTGTWIVRHTRNRPDLAWARDLGSMVHVSLIGYAVGGAFLNLGKFDLFYHLIAVIVLTRAVVEKELAATQTAADRAPHMPPLAQASPSKA
jgi:probable O-glycosylation ligase (exosortase A-associated)